MKEVAVEHGCSKEAEALCGFPIPESITCLGTRRSSGPQVVPCIHARTLLRCSIFPLIRSHAVRQSGTECRTSSYCADSL